MRKAVGFLGKRDDLPEGFAYSLKRRLLGAPMVNEQLGEQRLSNVLALGVLAPDGISSSAYGTEEILIELLKGGLGIAAFTLILPLTGVVLFVMALVVLSYREVVTVYTRAGGSYVVARDNFGPRVAQVAAVALLIDYVVTVAVQVAAGTAAVASAVPAINSPTIITVISIGVVILMCYGNLRGIREAGRSFAIPTYLFTSVIILMIVVGLLREAFGTLPLYHPGTGVVSGTPSHSGLIAFGMIFVLLRAFANGGSSLTGIEAVSNAVSAFRPPEGLNARRVLVTEGVILGSLVAGISWLAHATHARPYTNGVPTVISQEARLVFGHSFAGTGLYILVQAATALILYTGGNTSFNGFPFLANFVAEDAFLPRWLTKRGHRLVFSNGIIVLAVLSCILLAAIGANVNRLVPFYAIGVFTAFTLAGFGMAKYHHTHKERHWRRKLVINFSAGVTSLIVVLIFVVVKFTEGAWLVVILFAAGVPALIRLNREYGMEAQVLERISDRPKQPPEVPNYTRRTVFVFVDSFDLATIAALRYARSLRPTTLRAVHFVIDTAQADMLRQEWTRARVDVVLDFIDCADRRLTRAAAELVSAEAAQPGTHVTVVLPRRSYSPLIGRLLHDRTADKIAAEVSQIEHSVATIVPFDVRSRLEVLQARQAARAQDAAQGEQARAEQARTREGAERAQPAEPSAAADSGPAARTGPAAPTGPVPSDGPQEPAAPQAPAGPGVPGGPPPPAGHPAPTGSPAPTGLQPIARRPRRGGPAAQGEPTAPSEPAAGEPAAPGERAAGEPEVGEPAAPSEPAVGEPAAPGSTASPDGQPTVTAAPSPSPPRGLFRRRGAGRPGGPPTAVPGGDHPDYDRPVPPAGVNPIGSIVKPGRVTVEGRVHAVEIRPVQRNSVLAVEISDSTGDLTAMFYGRSHIPGLICGARVRFRGPVGLREEGPAMINPAYELLAAGTGTPAEGKDSPGKGD